MMYVYDDFSSKIDTFSARTLKYHFPIQSIFLGQWLYFAFWITIAYPYIACGIFISHVNIIYGDGYQIPLYINIQYNHTYPFI